jgi:hypothetical protein
MRPAALEIEIDRLGVAFLAKKIEIFVPECQSSDKRVSFAVRRAQILPLVTASTLTRAVRAAGRCRPWSSWTLGLCLSSRRKIFVRTGDLEQRLFSDGVGQLIGDAACYLSAFAPVRRIVDRWLFHVK